MDLTQNTGTTLTLAQGTITKNGEFNGTITGGILATPSGTFDVTTNGGVLKIGSALTGPSNRLIVSGAGTLELTSVDTANHNFGGGIFLNSGTLRVSDIRQTWAAVRPHGTTPSTLTVAPRNHPGSHAQQRLHR